MELIEIEWCSPQYQSALEIRHEVLRAPLGLKLTAEELDGEHGQLHFGMLDNDVLIATLTARPCSTTEIQLRQMAVHTGHQRVGVGTKLLLETEARLRERDFTSVFLNARMACLPFYEKNGYEKVGEPFEQIALPHQKMVKQLT
jgi:predicted GNAT family N-acyltransferase